MKIFLCVFRIFTADHSLSFFHRISWIVRLHFSLTLKKLNEANMKRKETSHLYRLHRNHVIIMNEINLYLRTAVCKRWRYFFALLNFFSGISNNYIWLTSLRWRVEFREQSLPHDLRHKVWKQLMPRSSYNNNSRSVLIGTILCYCITFYYYSSLSLFCRFFSTIFTYVLLLVVNG